MIIKINDLPFVLVEAGKVTVVSKFTLAFLQKFEEWLDS